ncbi:MAG: hypothetical protein ICV60_15480 [Pyrinomonadaceae bacterium]|nr:hypothetical protein [Pyrinomonadaceae bacterium]
MRKSLVTAAVGLHLSVTTIIYLAGKAGLLPPLFPDSLKYQTQIVTLAGFLREFRFAAWLFAIVPVHVKLYSLSFLPFSRWLDFSILLIEPLNALYFLAILSLVFKLSQQLFDTTTALLAAVIVGLWPSFLAHTTQPLHDALFIMTALLFLFINLRWLKKDYALRKLPAVAALGALTESLLWLTKSSMWELMIAINFISLGLLVIRLLKERKVVWGNLLGASLLLVIGLLIPRAALPFYAPVYYRAESYGVASLNKDNTAPPVEVPEESRQGETALSVRISNLRERFILYYPGAGSNIDTDVRFDSTADIIRYLPRAMLIGLFAPFPSMWFAAGSQNGRIGRIVGGAESLALYGIEVMALVGLWHKRREPSAWFLFAVAITAATALGLVVTNVGALYRMRYVFTMLLVILGSGGILHTLRLISSKKP